MLSQRSRANGTDYLLISLSSQSLHSHPRDLYLARIIDTSKITQQIP